MHHNRKVRRLTAARGACSHTGCMAPQMAVGLCSRHYNRRRSGAPMDTPFRIAKYGPGDVCIVPDCVDQAVNLRMCATHYGRHSTGVALNYRPKMRWRNASGYIMVIDRNGNHRGIGEHRAVMAAAIGRDLLPNENVHHVNGDRTDNRIENQWRKKVVGCFPRSPHTEPLEAS